MAASGLQETPTSCYISKTRPDNTGIFFLGNLLSANPDCLRAVGHRCAPFLIHQSANTSALKLTFHD